MLWNDAVKKSSMKVAIRNSKDGKKTFFCYEDEYCCVIDSHYQVYDVLQDLSKLTDWRPFEFATVEDAAHAYVACGKECGYAIAEIVLSRYLPKDKPYGKCYDVKAKDMPLLVLDLIKTTKLGFDVLGQRMYRVNEPNIPVEIKTKHKLNA